jgi:hypothetical protein
MALSSHVQMMMKYQPNIKNVYVMCKEAAVKMPFGYRLENCMITKNHPLVR